MKAHLTTRADHLRAMQRCGLAYYCHPGSGYTHVATGPSFSNDVRVAGVEDFTTAEELAAAAPDRIFTLNVKLPDYSLSD